MAGATDMKKSEIAAVIAYWDEHDVRHLPGVSHDEVRAFENRCNVALPDDMRCFYRTTNGTRVPLYGQDHEAYEFWRLSELQPDSNYDWAVNFADYREMSWWYATDLTGAGRLSRGTVYLMGADEDGPLIIARSFIEFLRLYVVKDQRLRPAGAKAYHSTIAEASD